MVWCAGGEEKEGGCFHPLRLFNHLGKEDLEAGEGEKDEIGEGKRLASIGGPRIWAG